MNLTNLLPLSSKLTPSSQTKGSSRRKRRLSLALQGGGAFGAFTWGVLDRLLEDQIEFDTISGASSGAMNALLLASGSQHGGASEARERLERFWQKASALAASLKSLRTGLSLFPSRVMSPYQFNPLGLNPLREILREEIDFDRLAASKISLLISATRVRDGQTRIFRNLDITVEAALASAALPMVHHAVSIDHDWYWDGGYSANPPLIPLALESRGSNVLVVQIVPMHREELPRTPREINGRLTQITFNHSLMMELDMLAELTRVHGKGVLQDSLSRKLRRLRLHRIKAEDFVDGMTSQSATNLDWTFLTTLRDRGRAAAEAWLADASFR